MYTRGFKNWCETIALQRRRMLNLRAVDPLEGHRLAESMAVLVHSADEVPGLDVATRRALAADSGGWSAVTITDGAKSVIILNAAHSGGRTSSDLMHELAHLLLGHSPGHVDLTDDGALMLSTYERQQEDEANWLAGCLLLPREALVWLRREGQELPAAARHFKVSLEMLQYRLRVTGVDYQIRRTGRFAG